MARPNHQFFTSFYFSVAFRERLVRERAARLEAERRVKELEARLRVTEMQQQNRGQQQPNPPEASSFPSRSKAPLTGPSSPSAQPPEPQPKPTSPPPTTSTTTTTTKIVIMPSYPPDTAADSATVASTSPRSPHLLHPPSLSSSPPVKTVEPSSIPNDHHAKVR